MISRKTSDETPTKEVVPKLDDLKQSEENDALTVDTGKQDSQFEQDNGEIIDKIDHFAIQDNSKISNSIFPDWRDNSESAGASAVQQQFLTRCQIMNTKGPSTDILNDLNLQRIIKQL